MMTVHRRLYQHHGRSQLSDRSRHDRTETNVLHCDGLEYGLSQPVRTASRMLEIQRFVMALLVFTYDSPLDEARECRHSSPYYSLARTYDSENRHTGPVCHGLSSVAKSKILHTRVILWSHCRDRFLGDSAQYGRTYKTALRHTHMG